VPCVRPPPKSNGSTERNRRGSTTSPLEAVLEWLQQDVDYLREHDLSGDAISEIKNRYSIDTFDAVLIDGSEFTGRAELEEVYGARFILLDDTETFKNWHNTRWLRADPVYRVVRADPYVRNGVRGVRACCNP
jgi:hypothetical protein